MGHNVSDDGNGKTSDDLDDVGNGATGDDVHYDGDGTAYDDIDDDCNGATGNEVDDDGNGANLSSPSMYRCRHLHRRHDSCSCHDGIVTVTDVQASCCH